MSTTGSDKTCARLGQAPENMRLVDNTRTGPRTQVQEESLNVTGGEAYTAKTSRENTSDSQHVSVSELSVFVRARAPHIAFLCNKTKRDSEMRHDTARMSRQI